MTEQRTDSTRRLPTEPEGEPKATEEAAATPEDRGRRGGRRRGRRRRGGRRGRRARRQRHRGRQDGSPRPSRRERLEQEGEIAADYLEELLEIADLDGDLDMDVEGDRATVSIVGAELPELVGDDGEVLEALQELTRLAVYRETGERSRLMLDVSGHRAERRTELEELAAEMVTRVQESGERAAAGPDVPLRAQGGARRRRGRRPDLGVRGRRAPPLRGGPAGLTGSRGFT